MVPCSLVQTFKEKKSSLNDLLHVSISILSQMSMQHMGSNLRRKQRLLPQTLVSAVEGGERLFSHSFIKLDAVFLKLLGVRWFSIGGNSSSSFKLPLLPGDVDDGGGDGVREEDMRDLETFFLLVKLQRVTCQ